ncbi:hypothetical protein BJX99DRAFT_206879 [Aspergillus californicus]
MSTFDGIVQEFPFITIDFFRKNPDRPPPLACFLSHVHSDHLQGLESFRAPFIYCSSATRELLLRIEKYPHRMNFNNGILESRRLHYKHLSKLLRPLPLNTPTEIDLTPRLSIRVTLLDANHCTGAVMFLIEGDGKTILYTGDIRSESWWVNGLVRHPVLIPYTLGRKRIDKLYLDTTFAHTSHASHTFPTKADGIAELLRKIEPYPRDTTFYFRAWTFGYEEVWVALAAALKSKVHVDRYQIGLYKSISSSCREGSGAVEAPSLCGFELGNRFIPGFLSEDQQSRIHSCEPGVHCPAASSNKTVYITPIVSRTENGSDVPEVGAGGGLGDLYQTHELELPDQSSLVRLEELCQERIQDPRALVRAREALLEAFKSRSKALSLGDYGMRDSNEMPLDELVNVLSRDRLSEATIFSEELKTTAEILDNAGKPLARTIHFPYSRHSSYAELCELVAAFKPGDIYPCTVNPLDWDEDISMQSLFGHLCSDNKFVHDKYMRDITAAENGERPKKRMRRNLESSTQSTQQSTIIDNDDDPRASQSLIQTIVGVHNIPNSHPRSHTGQFEPDPTAITTIPSSSVLAQSSHDSPVPASPMIIENLTDAHESDSLSFPPSSPEAAKSRRKAIRQTWHHLHEAQGTQTDQFHLGSLPSSWPTDGESSQLNKSTTGIQNLREITQGSSQVTTIRSRSIRTSEPNASSDKTVPERRSSPTPIFGNTIKPNKDMTTDTGTDIVPDYDPEGHRANTDLTNPDLDPFPSSPQSHIITASSSFLASQSQNQSQDRDKLQESFNEDNMSTTDEESVIEDKQVAVKKQTATSIVRPRSHFHPPALARRESSIRSRRAAYIAAREDSYDAWASTSLISTGNNHTEEEIEL